MLPPHTPLRATASLAPVGSLARLQQVLTIGALILAVGMAWALWSRSPLMALWVFGAILTVHAPVIALELALVALLHGDDPAPRPTWRELVRAWWAEVRLAPPVFAWRQPFCSLRWPDTAGAAPADRKPDVRAVVFIHGFVCNRAFWHPWMQHLQVQGIPYTSVSLEPVFGPIEDGLDQVEEAVARAEAATPHPPLVIGHSMGGLVARAWLARDARNSARVHRVVTIGTPHRGTWLARFSHLPNGRQMRQNGDWLTQLAAQESALHPAGGRYERFICWYSNADNVVFPASSATLPGADNRLVRGSAHVALAFHPRVMDESLAMVASGASSPMDRTAS